MGKSSGDIHRYKMENKKYSTIRKTLASLLVFGTTILASANFGVGCASPNSGSSNSGEYDKVIQSVYTSDTNQHPIVREKFVTGWGATFQINHLDGFFQNGDRYTTNKPSDLESNSE